VANIQTLGCACSAKHGFRVFVLVLGKNDGAGFIRVTHFGW